MRGCQSCPHSMALSQVIRDRSSIVAHGLGTLMPLVRITRDADMWRNRNRSDHMLATEPLAARCRAVDVDLDARKCPEESSGQLARGVIRSATHLMARSSWLESLGRWMRAVLTILTPRWLRW